MAVVRPEGLETTGREYPFLAYGTDWLAFAHLVIAVAFWGPLRDPVRNIWVVEFGMIACLLVIPLALICGPIRGIPFCWQLIDCSFGVFGLIPLAIVRRLILSLGNQESGLRSDRQRLAAARTSLRRKPSAGNATSPGCAADTQCGTLPRCLLAFVLSRRTRSKMRVAKGIRPARMMATQSGSIFIHATL